MIIARISAVDEALLTIDSIVLIGVLYLAIAVSGLRERIARLEGLLRGQRKNGGEE